MKYLSILIIFLSFFVFTVQNSCVLFGDETSEGPPSIPAGASLRIIFTGEENGYLEPCGCSEKQLGGLPKRQTLINSLKEIGENYVILGLGDLVKDVGRQDEIKLETILNALDQMGYYVHNIGEKDLNVGPDLLGYLSQISNVNFISSNIVNLGSYGIKVKPYIIKKINVNGRTYKIGILGILSPDLVENAPPPIEIIGPHEALSPLISRLEKDTDFLLLLSHAEIDISIMLAESFPEFNLIISGHGIDEPDLYIKKVNNTYVIPAGTKGKYLGVFTYPLDDTSGRPQTEIIQIDERYESSPGMKSLLQTYQQRLKDEELLKNVFRTDHPSGANFTGNEDCTVCHLKIFNHWKNTKHASAYETLVKAEHEHDPECVSCHVIGLEYTTGFETIETTPKKKGVGCESCHGPGSSHKLTLSKDYGKADVNTCTTCHNAEHSPNFDYGPYWQKIIHPKEIMTKLNQRADLQNERYEKKSENQ